jgi:hypothetical protein
MKESLRWNLKNQLAMTQIILQKMSTHESYEKHAKKILQNKESGT